MCQFACIIGVSKRVFTFAGGGDEDQQRQQNIIHPSSRQQSPDQLLQRDNHLSISSSPLLVLLVEYRFVLLVDEGKVFDFQVELQRF